MPKVRLLVMMIAAALSLTRLAGADDKAVVVTDSKNGISIVLTARLTNCTEATITITGTLMDMTSSVPLPLTVDMAGRTEAVLVTFTPSPGAASWHCSWTDTWKLGKRIVGAPEPYIYSLPYASSRFTVMQGPHGAFSHSLGSQDEEAIDWAMPIGTIVCAARPGIVTGFRADCTEGGADVKYKKDCNYVVVKHDDGTFAEYLHLNTNGILVHLGDHVTLNQPIGLSGNTGYTSAPHLHFAVFYALDGSTRKTIPVRFKSRAGATISPRQGYAY